MTRFVQRHRTVARWMYRVGLGAWMSRRVWAEMEAMPGFSERMAAGERYFEGER